MFHLVWNNNRHCRPPPFHVFLTCFPCSNTSHSRPTAPTKAMRLLWTWWSLTLQPACDPRPSAPLGQSDHSIVLGRLCIPTCTTSPPAPNTTLPSHSFQIPDFSQFDISSILPTHLVALNESIANLNWHAALQLKLGDPNRTAPAFYDILHGLCSAFLPTRSRSSAPIA